MQSKKSRITEFDAKLGKRLRSIRNALSLNMLDVGTMLAISPQQVAKYEQGKNRISVGTLRKLCAIYDCSISDVIANL